MLLYATVNNILVLLVEETGVPRENHQTAASQRQTLSHKVASRTPRHERDSNKQRRSFDLEACLMTTISRIALCALT